MVGVGGGGAAMDADAAVPGEHDLPGRSPASTAWATELALSAPARGLDQAAAAEAVTGGRGRAGIFPIHLALCPLRIKKSASSQRLRKDGECHR
jgi:hypothetical protein